MGTDPHEPLEVMLAITCAPITRTVRGIRSEVEVGAGEARPEASVVTRDNLVTVPKSDLDRVESSPGMPASATSSGIVTCRSTSWN